MLKEPNVYKSFVADEQHKRSGVERFVTENARCPQADSAKLPGHISVLFGRVVSCIAPPEQGTIEAEGEIYSYIDALNTRMVDGGVSQEKARAVTQLLKRMTGSDPQQRPSMQCALKDLKEAARLE